MTVPNIITVFRIILVPIFCILFFTPGMKNAAFTILILSGVSDVCDGYIARKFKQISDLGKILDPIADKLFQFSTAICLVIDGKVGVWLLIVMSAKDLFMLVGGSVFYYKTHAVIASRWYGKVMSVLLFSAFITSFLLDFIRMDLSISFAVVSCLFAAAMIFSVMAAVKYTKSAVIINNEHKQKLGNSDGH